MVAHAASVGGVSRTFEFHELHHVDGRLREVDEGAAVEEWGNGSDLDRTRACDARSERTRPWAT